MSTPKVMPIETIVLLQDPAEHLAVAEQMCGNCPAYRDDWKAEPVSAISAALSFSDSRPAPTSGAPS